MKTDIEIAQSIELQPIVDVVKKIGIDYDDLELYGKYKAKLSFDKISEVRKKLVSMQQEMAKNANVIMDGRDICNHVLPKAQVKIFLTASVDERASRRFNEMTEKGVKCDFEELKREIEYRDRNDSEREEAPLRQAPDAVLLDTTGMTFDEVVKKVTEMAEAVM